MTAQPPAWITEAALQQGIVQCARQLGFLVYHTAESRLSEPGFPDLVVVGHGTVVVFELKSQKGRLRPMSVTKKGRRMPGQWEWLEAFLEAGVYAAVVRPTATRDAIGYDDALEVLMLRAADR